MEAQPSAAASFKRLRLLLDLPPPDIQFVSASPYPFLGLPPFCYISPRQFVPLSFRINSRSTVEFSTTVEPGRALRPGLWGGFRNIPIIQYAT